MLEETASTTATQQEMRAQRESELAVLKRTLQEEMASSESSLTTMRQKHTRAMEELNNQLDTMKKVTKEEGREGMKGGREGAIKLQWRKR